MNDIQGRSLHIGVNEVDPEHYAGWSGPLVACEADAEDMQELALSRGFDTQIRKTAEATRDAVRENIMDAAASLSPGDFFFLSYSGHGGQVPDKGGDEDDLKDETWCLYDGQHIDDELYDLWHEFAEGVRILVLSDSCHSGSAVRAPGASVFSETLNRGPVAEILGIAGAAIRCMPDLAAVKAFRANRGFYNSIQENLPAVPREVKATVRLISGCQDNQYSLDGTFNGLFTGMLLRVWNNGRFDDNYSRFHSAILERMPSTQSPNHMIVGQCNPAYDAETPFTIKP